MASGMRLWLCGLLLMVGARAEGEGGRSQACRLLIAVDQYAFETAFHNHTEEMVRKVLRYVDGLNRIYQYSILQDPPYESIYFSVGEIRVLDNFMNDCNNKDVILAEFTKVAKSSTFCLAHLLTYRDFGCVIGLATIGGLCMKYGNVGFTKMENNETRVINTIAHEIGHNFGSDHDGAEQIQYRSCTGQRAGIMSSGLHPTFSTCSLSAMHAKLQKVLQKEQEGVTCFVTQPQPKFEDPKKVVVTREDLSSHIAECPRPPPDECQDDFPDPPEAPDPPPEPVCGDLQVEEPFEECDCGADYFQCEDPCCYPATLSQYDLDLNASALPCHRNEKQVCIQPYKANLRFGLIFPFLFILLLAAILAIILWVDWRCGARRLYFHITEREERMKEHLHVETEEQRERRVKREMEQTRLRA